LPYSKDDLDKLPSATESLYKHQKEKFVDVYNALLENNPDMDESEAIPLAISQVKKLKLKKASETLNSIIDEEKKISVDVVYEPFAVDVHGQWMSDVTVRKACEDFNIKLAEGKINPNLFHALNTDKFSILKSWINEVDATIGEHFVPEGTWLCSIQYNDQLWEMKKSGEIGGISIGALGAVHEPKIKTGDVDE